MTRRGGRGMAEMADATTTGPPQPPQQQQQQQQPMEFKDVLAKTFKDLLVWASDPFSECSNRGTQNSSSSSSSSSSSHGIAPGGGGGDARSSSNDETIDQKCAFMRFVDGLLNRPPPAPPAPVSPDEIPPYLPKSILRQKSRYPRSPKHKGGRRGRRGGGGGGGRRGGGGGRRGGGGSAGCASATDGDDNGAGYVARTSGGGYGGLEGFAGFDGFDGLDGGICGVCGSSGSGVGGVGGSGDCPRRGAYATATARAGVRWAPDVAVREKWGALPEVPTRDKWWAFARLMPAPRTRAICWGSTSKWTTPPCRPKSKPVPVPEPEPDPRIQYMPDLTRYAPETHREPLQETESEVESNAVPENEPESKAEVEFEAQSLREVQQPALKPTRTVIVQNPRVFSRAARFAAEDDDDDFSNGTGNARRNLNGNYGNPNGSHSGNFPRIGGENANGGGNTHFDGDCVGNGVVKDKVENDGQGVFGAGRRGGRGGRGGGGPKAWDFMDGGRMTDITLVGLNRVKARKAREAAELEDFAHDSDDTDDSDEEDEEEGGGRGWMSYGYDGSMASLKSVDFSSSPSGNRKRAPCPPSGIGLLREIKPSPAQWMTAQQLDEILGSTAGWKNKGVGGSGGGRSGRNGFGSGSRAKFHQRTGSSGGNSSSSSRSSRSSCSSSRSSCSSSRSNSSSGSGSGSSSGSDDDANREESLLSVKGAGDEFKAAKEGKKVDEWKVEDVAAEVCGNARFTMELFELAKEEHWAGLLFKRAYLNSQEG